MIFQSDELDNEIKKDIALSMNESTLFLNEDVDTRFVPSSVSNVSKKKKKKSSFSKDTYLKFKGFISDLRTKSDMEIANNSMSLIERLYKFTVFSFGGVYLIGFKFALPFIIGKYINQVNKAESLNKMKIRLNAKLDSIDTHIKDMESAESLSEEEKKEKYKLVEMKSLTKNAISNLDEKIAALKKETDEFESKVKEKTSSLVNKVKGDKNNES